VERTPCQYDCCACSRRPAGGRSASTIRRSGPRSRAWIALRRRSASTVFSLQVRYSRPHIAVQWAVMRVLSSAAASSAPRWVTPDPRHEVEWSTANRGRRWRPVRQGGRGIARLQRTLAGRACPSSDPADADAAQPARHLPLLDAAMWRWGLMMLAHCTARACALNKSRMVADRRIQPRLPEGAARSAGIPATSAHRHAAAVPDAESTHGIAGDVAALKLAELAAGGACAPLENDRPRSAAASARSRAWPRTPGCCAPIASCWRWAAGRRCC